MTDDHAEVPCGKCGWMVNLSPDVEWAPSDIANVQCDDCFFEQFGDMLTPGELRRSTLRNPENARLQAEWLAEYAVAGIADDQDPGSFTLEVPAGTSVDEIPGLAATAVALRFSTPQDFA